MKSILAAIYTMSKDEYSSNIFQCVNLIECKIINMKTHNCRIILHRHLPLAIHEILSKEVCKALIEFNAFFRELCSKVLNLDDLEHLEHQIASTLYKMERIFPLVFFDIMVHLAIHLASEAKMLDQYNIDGCIPLKDQVIFLCY